MICRKETRIRGNSDKGNERVSYCSPALIRSSLNASQFLFNPVMIHNHKTILHSKALSTHNLAKTSYGCHNVDTQASMSLQKHDGQCPVLASVSNNKAKPLSQAPT